MLKSRARVRSFLRASPQIWVIYYKINKIKGKQEHAGKSSLFSLMSGLILQWAMQRVVPTLRFRDKASSIDHTNLAHYLKLLSEWNEYNVCSVSCNGRSGVCSVTPELLLSWDVILWADLHQRCGSDTVLQAGAPAIWRPGGHSEDGYVKDACSFPLVSNGRLRFLTPISKAAQFCSRYHILFQW